MSAAGSLLPLPIWRSKPVLIVISRVASRTLKVGRVNLTGLTSNGQTSNATGSILNRP
jgi:hypothetical protein